MHVCLETRIENVIWTLLTPFFLSPPLFLCSLSYLLLLTAIPLRPLSPFPAYCLPSPLSPSFCHSCLLSLRLPSILYPSCPSLSYCHFLPSFPSLITVTPLFLSPCHASFPFSLSSFPSPFSSFPSSLYSLSLVYPTHFSLPFPTHQHFNLVPFSLTLLLFSSPFVFLTVCAVIYHLFTFQVFPNSTPHFTIPASSHPPLTLFLSRFLAPLAFSTTIIHSFHAEFSYLLSMLQDCPCYLALLTNIRDHLERHGLNNDW